MEDISDLEYIQIPNNIIEQIKFFCESIDCGFVVVSSNGFSIILLGNIVLSPDQIAIIGAHALLEGVMEKRFILQPKEEKKEH